VKDQNKISQSTGSEQQFLDTVVNGLFANTQITLEKVCDMTDDAQSYSVICACSKPYDPKKPTILLTAGSHGDEPAGILAVIRFLNNDLQRYASRFNIVAFPCLNPSGFNAGIHNTASGINLNDHFGRQSDDDAVRAIENKIKSIAPSVVLSFDLHEDNSGDQLGCYVYEMISRSTNQIAHRVLGVLSPADICQQPVIYGENNTNGVIGVNADESQTALGSLHGYLKSQGVQHVMVIETPTEWPLEKRIKTHLAMIQRGLESI
jgi:predicted deacylase